MANVFIDDNTLREIDEITKSENEIKNKLEKSTTFDNNYKDYGYLNNNWYQEYKKNLNDVIAGQANKKYNFKITEMKNKNDSKSFVFLNKSYNFISQFIIVTKNFIDLLSNYFYEQREKKIFLIYFSLH